MEQIVRPVNGRIRVMLPFQRGGANFRLLEAICGGRSGPEWNRELRCFEVPRAHLRKLIERLPDELGTAVQVVLHGARQTKCVSACWGANPDSWWECVCSCAGANHGTGHPLAKQVAPDLSVSTDYTSTSYTLLPRN
jgi:hypothetical protein